MKLILVLGLLASTLNCFGQTNSMEHCVGTRVEGITTWIESTCNEDVFVFFCGPSDYYKAPCKGEYQYYPYVVSLQFIAGITRIRLDNLHGEVKFAACRGTFGGGYPQIEINKDDGSYTCLR